MMQTRSKKGDKGDEEGSESGDETYQSEQNPVMDLLLKMSEDMKNLQETQDLNMKNLQETQDLNMKNLQETQDLNMKNLQETQDMNMKNLQEKQDANMKNLEKVIKKNMEDLEESNVEKMNQLKDEFKEMESSLVSDMFKRTEEQMVLVKADMNKEVIKMVNTKVDIVYEVLKTDKNKCENAGKMLLEAMTSNEEVCKKSKEELLVNCEKELEKKLGTYENTFINEVANLNQHKTEEVKMLQENLQQQEVKSKLLEEEIKKMSVNMSSMGSSSTVAHHCSNYTKVENIAQFGADKTGMHPMTYLSNIMKYLEDIPSLKHQMEVMKSTLNNSALEWFQSMEDNCQDMNQFEDMFKKNFWNESHQNKAKISLLTAKYSHGNLTSEAYASSMYNQCKYVSDLNEYMIASQLLNHFIFTDTQAMICQKVNDMDSLIEMLRSLDDFNDVNANSYSSLPSNNFNNGNQRMNNNGSSNYFNNTDFKNGNQSDQNNYNGNYSNQNYNSSSPNTYSQNTQMRGGFNNYSNSNSNNYQSDPSNYNNDKSYTQYSGTDYYTQNSQTYGNKPKENHGENSQSPMHNISWVENDSDNASNENDELKKTPILKEDAYLNSKPSTSQS